MRLLIALGIVHFIDYVGGLENANMYEGLAIIICFGVCLTQDVKELYG